MMLLAKLATPFRKKKKYDLAGAWQTHEAEMSALRRCRNNVPSNPSNPARESEFAHRAPSMPDRAVEQRGIALTRARDFGIRGFTLSEVWCLRHAARKYGWRIYVREGHPSRLLHVMLRGGSPPPPVRFKPAGIYPKTVKEGPAAGYVAMRSSERADADAVIREIIEAGGPLSEEGWHWEDGGDGWLYLTDGANVRVCGDIDLGGVYRAKPDGSMGPHIPAQESVPALNAILDRISLAPERRSGRDAPATKKSYGVKPMSRIQHGAHDEWEHRNSSTYAGGVNMGPMGPFLGCFESGERPRSFTTKAYLEEQGALGVRDVYGTAARAKGLGRHEGPRRRSYTGVPRPPDYLDTT